MLISKRKALRLYIQLIIKRMREPIMINAKGVCEVHHIIPKCVLNNRKIANSKYNLISLYTHEHFLAHYYLSVIFPNEIGVQRAYYLMSNMKNRKSYLNVEELADAYSKAKKKIAKRNSNKTYSQIYGHKASEKIKIKQKKSKLNHLIRFINVDK